MAPKRLQLLPGSFFHSHDHSSSSTLEISTNHKGLLQHPEQSWYCQSAAVFLLFSLAGKVWAPQVSKGCLLDYSPAWRHWPASRNDSEVVRTIAQVVGHFSIIHKHWVRSPHCMYQVKSQQSWGRGRNLRHTVQWFSPFSAMWPLIYFLKLCCPSLKLFRCYFITEISLI